MALPASENTTTLRQAYVIREYGEGFHLPSPNGGTAVNQGDLVKAGPWFGVADEDIDANTTGTIHCATGFRVGAAVTGSAQTFADFGQAVFYSTADGKLYEADSAGARFVVGYVSVVADANGVFEFKGVDTVSTGLTASS